MQAHLMSLPCQKLRRLEARKTASRHQHGQRALCRYISLSVTFMQLCKFRRLSAAFLRREREKHLGVHRTGNSSPGKAGASLPGLAVHAAGAGPDIFRPVFRQLENIVGVRQQGTHHGNEVRHAIPEYAFRQKWIMRLAAENQRYIGQGFPIAPCGIKQGRIFHHVRGSAVPQTFLPSAAEQQGAAAVFRQQAGLFDSLCKAEPALHEIACVDPEQQGKIRTSPLPYGPDDHTRKTHPVFRASPELVAPAVAVR